MIEGFEHVVGMKWIDARLSVLDFGDAYAVVEMPTLRVTDVIPADAATEENGYKLADIRDSQVVSDDHACQFAVKI